MFNVNNKNTRTTSQTSFSMSLFYNLRAYFTSPSGVSMVDFEQVNVCHEEFHNILGTIENIAENKILMPYFEWQRID